jgi:hypothetical protein
MVQEGPAAIACADGQQGMVIFNEVPTVSRQYS